MSELAILFDKVEAHVEGGITALNNGEVADLSGLDVDVQALCSHVNNLPAEEAGEQLQRLQQVMERLDVFSEKLKEEQMQVRSQIDGLNQQKKAMQAYQSAPKPPAAPKTDDSSEG